MLRSRPEEALTDTINTHAGLDGDQRRREALEAALVEAGVQPQARSNRARAAGHVCRRVHRRWWRRAHSSYADGLRLVRERGRLMKEAGEKAPGMMAAILGLDERRR